MSAIATLDGVRLTMAAHSTQVSAKFQYAIVWIHLYDIEHHRP
jgi:hypothetical protein